MSGPGCCRNVLSLSLFPPSLAIPQFGLLSHLSSPGLSSGHSGTVPTLSMQSAPPCSAPAPCWQTGVSGLPFHWESQLGAKSLCSFLFFFPPGYIALWNSKIPHRPTGERVSWCLETSPPSQLPPQDRALSLILLSLFLSFIFCPTSFQREWAAFLGACLLCQHSEVVLWNLFSIQMIFQWICRGEWGLPILFLLHLRTTLPPRSIFKMTSFCKCRHDTVVT